MGSADAYLCLLLNRMPTVSVVIPAYNAEHTLDVAIRSVLAQDCQVTELLVVDDGSLDATAQVASQHQHVQLFRRPNGGAAAARNFGVARSTGEFIAFLDADDRWHPGKLAAQLQAMQQHPDADLCRCRVTEDAVRFDSDVKTWESGQRWPMRVVEDFGPTLLDPFFGLPTIMVRRQAFARIGGFDERLRIAEDVDFYLRLLIDRPKNLVIEHPLLYVHQTAQGLGGDSVAGYVQLLDVYRRLIESRPERFASGDLPMRRAFASLELLHARSLLRRSERHLALRASARSFAWRPSAAALGVVARLAVPEALRSRLKRAFAR
jgi:glycosyltransferase involved in cell wall biosynthesis